jgi:hypothetical protein
METKIYAQETAATRLADLGLTESELHQAIEAGELERGTCHPDYPATARGYYTYAATVAMLRRVLKMKGWTRYMEKNLELTLSPDGATAIAVSSGDEGTGRKQTGSGETSPQPRSPKGPMVVSAAQGNYQLSFPWGNQKPATHRTTWLLLHFRDRNEIRCELSSPAGIDETGRVTDWLERIILSPVRLSDAELTPAPVPEDEPPIEFDIAPR